MGYKIKLDLSHPVCVCFFAIEKIIIKRSRYEHRQNGIYSVDGAHYGSF